MVFCLSSYCTREASILTSVIEKFKSEASTQIYLALLVYLSAWLSLIIRCYLSFYFGIDCFFLNSCFYLGFGFSMGNMSNRDSWSYPVNFCTSSSYTNIIDKLLFSSNLHVRVRWTMELLSWLASFLYILTLVLYYNIWYKTKEVIKTIKKCQADSLFFLSHGKPLPSHYKQSIHR